MLFSIACLYAPQHAVAQAQTPFLEGTFETEVGAGWLRGDVCLSDLPAQQGFTFVLHRGLNIREVRDANTGAPLGYAGAYNAVGVGDATRYTVTDSVGAGGFCVRYLGAFPVYRVDEGERNVTDWKGLIAFNGRTVRATEQTRFYPVVEDSLQGGQAVAVRYEVTVRCADCDALYLNGSAPAAGPEATFRSTVPRQLFLYAGAFPYSDAAGLRFVGAEADPADAEVIRAGIGRIADVHARYLDVAYEEAPTYLTFASISRTRHLGRNTWGFVTWPTLALDGRVSFATLIEADSTTGQRGLKKNTIRFLAHEMAHHYFGTRYLPSGPLRWFLLESTAEFLGLHAVRTLLGEATYTARLQSHLKAVESAGEVVPLHQVQEAERIGGGYRYQLGPLLLTVLEQDVGAEVVQQTLRSLVVDPPQGDVDYAHFRARLEAAGATPAALDRFEQTCLTPRPWEGCLARFAADPR